MWTLFQSKGCLEEETILSTAIGFQDDYMKM